MKFIELTLHQHGDRKQDPGIALNIEHIVKFTPFLYNTGTIVTTILLDTGERIDVAESYKDILKMIKDFR